MRIRSREGRFEVKKVGLGWVGRKGELGGSKRRVERQQRRVGRQQRRVGRQQRRVERQGWESGKDG
jgi:hypothetical protein